MKTKIDARLEAKRIIFSYEKELIGCSSQNSKLIKMFELGFEFATKSQTINNDIMKNKCFKCEDYKWDIIDNSLVPCSECNPNGKYEAKEITVCLGCGCDINIRDCGCPAGTANRLLKYEN